MPRSHTIVIAAAAVVATLAGCVHNPVQGLRPSGEPLAYDWDAFRQGRAPIDEEDFYRIAGDDAAAVHIARERARGARYHKLGWVIAAIGLAGLVVGTVSSDARGPGLGLALGLPLGGTMAFYGQQRAERHPQLPGARARQAAARYNARLGVEQESRR